MISPKRCRSLTRRETDFISSVMGDAVEVTRQVRVDDFRMPRAEQPVDLPDGVQGAVLGPIRVLLRLQVRLEDRLQDQHHGHLHHAVSNRSDPQRPLFAIRFGDVNATHGLRLVRLLPQVFRQFVQPLRPRRTPRCPRTSGRRSPAHRRWNGSGRRRMPGRRDGTPCRTAGRSDSRAIPSLWHATSPGVSEPFPEVRGSRQSPGSRALSDVGLELRPLPSTGVDRLHRYYEPVRHPGRPGLSLAGVRLGVTRSRRWGFPCCLGSPCARMPSSLPRWNPWFVSLHEA